MTKAQPPIAVFHDLGQALGLLRAAAEGGRAIVLRTAPGAASYAGPLYLIEIAKQAAAEVATAEASFEIDCGDDPMAVFAALDAGWSRVLFTGPKKLRDRLAPLAARQGAAFDHRRGRPTALAPDDDGYDVGRTVLGI